MTFFARQPGAFAEKCIRNLLKKKMLYADFSTLVADGYVRATEDGLLFAVDLTIMLTGKSRDESNFLLRNLDSSVFSQVQNISFRKMFKSTTIDILSSWTIFDHYFPC